jgi:PAS domain S-box-containing protein
MAADPSAALDTSVFRGVFDAYPDAVLLVDAAGRITLANPAAAALFGFSVEALHGLSVDTLVPSAVASRHAGLRQGYAQAPRPRPMGNELELTARRADGSEVMVEISLSPLSVAGVPHVVAAIRGIGAYPRVQRAMRRARYNDFIAQAGRAAVDLGEPQVLIERGALLAAHALEVEALGVWLLRPGRLEFRCASSVVQASDPNVRSAAQALVEQVLPNRPDTLLGYVAAQAQTIVISSFARENRFSVRPELRRGSIQCALAVPMVRAGSVIGVVLAGSVRPGRFDDEERYFVEAVANLFVTGLQRAETEAQLAHAQRLETVGQLTGGIAHDFNNLLTVIQGNLQMIADHPAVTGDGTLAQMVGAATRAGQRGAELTGKLLAFARRQRLAAGPVDVGALLHALAGMLQRTIGERIRVHVHTDGSCPPCLADPSQLESALLNIAVNSRDAMPDGGELSFACARCHVLPPQLRAPVAASAAAESAGWVAITIRDTGVGMSPDVLDRAFEPFFTTKDAGKGTGLGLSTVYGFVKQSGGHVAVESAVSKGTTITLLLPVAEVPGAPAPGAAEAAPPPPGTRVLLVEDDAGVRAVALAFLQAMGCAVTVCADAEAALAELETRAGVDLLFSDITLGAGIDGIELARRARALAPGLRVLLTSGYSRYLAADSPHRPREWPVLQKPYSREQLSAAMAGALRGATEASARSDRAPPG